MELHPRTKELEKELVLMLKLVETKALVPERNQKMLDKPQVSELVMSKLAKPMLFKVLKQVQNKMDKLHAVKETKNVQEMAMTKYSAQEKQEK
jgi:hypothetical protein